MNLQKDQVKIIISQFNKNSNGIYFNNKILQLLQVIGQIHEVLVNKKLLIIKLKNFIIENENKILSTIDCNNLQNFLKYNLEFNKFFKLDLLKKKKYMFMTLI